MSIQLSKTIMAKLSIIFNDLDRHHILHGALIISRHHGERHAHIVGVHEGEIGNSQTLVGTGQSYRGAIDDLIANYSRAKSEGTLVPLITTHP